MAVGRVVVLRALGLGDLLTGVPALRAIARAFSDHDLVLAAPIELAELMTLIPDAPFHVVDVRGLDEPLPRELARPAVAINLHGRGPQSHALLRALEPERLMAFDDVTVWRAGEHEVARWCRLLREHGIEADPAELAIEPPPVEPPEVARGATLIHPGAASAARRWPPERFAEVARHEAALGRPVAVTGSATEGALAERVAALADLPADSVLAGRTRLLELAAAVAAAARVIAGDTGVSHLATALGRPSVTLFGPTPPAAWGPPPLARHRVLWGGRAGDPHATSPDAGLLAIGADDVLHELEALEQALPEHPRTSTLRH